MLYTLLSPLSTHSFAALRYIMRTGMRVISPAVQEGEGRAGGEKRKGLEATLAQVGTAV
jgi:hypothetical protein